MNTPNMNTPNEYITCECGCVIKSNYEIRHLKSKRHNDIMGTPDKTPIINCECGSKINILNRQTHLKSKKHNDIMGTPDKIKKTYYMRNIYEQSDKRQAYYIKNKERILARNREKIICDCGTKLSKSSLKRHKKTEKHKKLMLNK